MLTGKLVERVEAHKAAVRDVSWHPLEPILATASVCASSTCCYCYCCSFSCSCFLLFLFFFLLLLFMYLWFLSLMLVIFHSYLITFGVLLVGSQSEIVVLPFIRLTIENDGLYRFT